MVVLRLVWIVYVVLFAYLCIVFEFDCLFGFVCFGFWMCENWLFTTGIVLVDLAFGCFELL